MTDQPPDVRAASEAFRRGWIRLIVTGLVAALIAWGAVAGGAWGLGFAIFVILLRLNAISESVDAGHGTEGEWK